MQPLQNLTQAYSQAPWRRQWQLIGLFLLILVMVWLVAALYLDITARAAAIGREIQSLQVRSGSLTVNSELDSSLERMSIEEMEQVIADLQTQLAYQTSDARMAARAEVMGFESYPAEAVTYFESPGYSPRQTAVLAPPPGMATTSAPVYQLPIRQSLGDWLKEQLTLATHYVTGVQP